MSFNNKHLKHFKDCYISMIEFKEWNRGKKVRNFAREVLSEPESTTVIREFDKEKIADRAILRSEAWNFIESDSDNNLAKVICVLAWGGMNLNHAKLAFRSYDRWGKIVDGMTKGDICRFQAYEWFQCLIKNGVLDGMGPAYFTKLIYFLEKCHRGYILDQWTARSLNLLRNSDSQAIWLIPGGSSPSKERNYYYVHPVKNDVSIYEAFCNDLESLTMAIPNALAAGSRSKEEAVEKAIFSHGGRCGQLGGWRSYVLDNTHITLHRGKCRKKAECSANCLGCMNGQRL